MLTEEQLKDLLSDLEADNIERTVSVSNTDKFGQAICAFANDLSNRRSPGYLLIGVKDNGALSGLTVTDELLQNLAAQRRPLLRLGILQLVSTLLVLGVDLLFDAGDWSALVGDQETLQPLHLLRLTLIASPMFMAFWFAPLLTAWDGVPAAKSLFFSLVASLRNWRAFLAYGAVVALIGVVLPGLLLFVAAVISTTLLTLLSAAMPMLLLLVFAPVLMASVYLSYRDVFSAAVDVDA